MTQIPDERQLNSLLGSDIPELPVVYAQVKRMPNYTIRIPDDPEDLQIQLFFTEPWESLVNSRKIFTLQDKISKMLEKLDTPHIFSVELIPSAESLFIGSEGYLKELTNTARYIADKIEEVLSEVL